LAVITQHGWVGVGGEENSSLQVAEYGYQQSGFMPDPKWVLSNDSTMETRERLAAIT
jgi:hypothetical protein